VIDKDEFTEWWVGQTEGSEGAGEVERTLAKLRDLGRQRFRVDIFTACWSGFEEVVVRLIEDGSELHNEKDSSEYGVRFIHDAALAPLATRKWFDLVGLMTFFLCHCRTRFPRFTTQHIKGTRRSAISL
jgi:hypothetical protein